MPNPDRKIIWGRQEQPLVPQFIFNLILWPLDVLEVIDALEMAVEFVHLVVDHTTTEVNFTKVYDPHLPRERYLRHPILVMQHFNIEHLNVFPEVIDHYLV